jgi:hypothetical protein
VDLLAFGHTLETLRLAEIRAVSSRLAERDCIADEVERTRAVMHVDRVVRRDRRRNQAGLAAVTAISLVQDAARRDGAQLPDADVTRVARAAALVARALVCGPVARREAELLARAFDCTTATAL